MTLFLFILAVFFSDLALGQTNYPVMREYVPLPENVEVVDTLPSHFRRVEELPSRFDWRSHDGHNWITPVKNQGRCGSCWAFASTAQFEAAIKILLNKPDLDLDLAEQELVSCDYDYFGCYGGNFSYNYMQDVGLTTEECFPYDTTQDTSYWYPCDSICEDAQAGRKFQMTAYVVDADYDMESIKTTVYWTPMYFNIAIYPSFYYLSSITPDYVWSPDLDDPEDTIVGYHAMLCVGWNDDERYFTFKNSWGTEWGCSGFVNISYDCISLSSEKPVWADGLVFPTEYLSAQVVENWTISGILIKSDTVYWEISDEPQMKSTDRFFSASGRWYFVEGWSWSKDTVYSSGSEAGSGDSFTVVVDAPMTVNWMCKETTAVALDCLEGDNLLTYPNPFDIDRHRNLKISFKLCKSGVVDVKIYDVGYNLVSWLIRGQQYSDGIYLISWDGLADDGREATPGVYFVVVSSSGGEFGLSKVIVE